MLIHLGALFVQFTLVERRGEGPLFERPLLDGMPYRLDGSDEGEMGNATPPTEARCDKYFSTLSAFNSRGCVLPPKNLI